METDQILSSAISVMNKKLASYMRAGEMAAARNLFEKMLPHADAVSWNTILACCRRAGHSPATFHYFLRMRRAGVGFTARTLATSIAAAADGGTGMTTLLSQLHAVALPWSSNAFISTALISGYAKAGDISSACQLFYEMPTKSSPSWTALISGMMDVGCSSLARQLFDKMHVKTIPAWTAMVAGLINNGNDIEARRLFNAMPMKTIVSWTALIKGYIGAGMFSHALNLFVEMRSSREAPSPNEVTFSTVLGACAGVDSLLAGMAIHADLLKSGAPPDAILASSLVNMYSKCGDFESSLKVFEQMGGRWLESWNAAMACCAQHGLGARAVLEFERMQAAGVGPDAFTFVSLLAACARGGMVEEGRRWFEEMGRVFGVEAGVEHWGCVVDMLGRAGDLEGAARVVKMMGNGDEVMAGALSWAGGEHGREMVEAGRMGFGELPAVLMARKRVSGEKGDWGAVAEIRKGLPPKSLQRAASWISL